MIFSSKNLLAAAAVALAPLAASAATINSGDTVDILAEDVYEYDTDFMVNAAGDTLTFTFENNGAADAVLTFFGITVEQSAAAFSDGVDVMFGPYTTSFDEGVTGGDSTTFQIAAMSSATLTITFGDVVDVGPTGGNANIDFSVAAAVVPLPAAGLLLLTALGGVAAMRRRKTAA